MKNIICTLLISLCVGLNLNAQKLDIPANLNLQNEEDYQQTEQLFLQSAKWALETPLNVTPEKRKEVYAFLMKWMTGSPLVSIELRTGVVPVDCSDCLLMFLSGWTVYSLENNYSKNKIDCALAGVENTIAFYELNKEIMGKNKDLDKLVKHKQKGKLLKHVESNYNVN